MDIKDSYLHGTVGVVKSISVSADKLTYNLADVNNTAKTITLPLVTQTANGLMSKEDKTKLDQSTGMNQAIPYIVGSTSDTAGVWTGVYSGITEYTDGLTIIYVPKVSGKSSGTTLNINNLGAKNCHYTNASNLTTHFGTGVPIILTYIGGYWKRADYDSWTPYVAAYCTTAAATAAKAASCNSYVLTSKTYIHMLITTANTAQSALTMNINSKGAKPIYINGAASSASNYTLPAGTYIVYYDGTNYYFRTDGVLPGTIEKATNATSASKVANNLVIKLKSGSTEGTDLYTYNGSAAKTLDIKQGTGITLTAAANALTITNSGVRSIATGTTNGTISVNTNGTSANVAVKGLGSAAYTSTDLYLKQLTIVHTNTEDILYKKVTITKNATDGYGIWVHSRHLHYLINSGLSGGSTIGNVFWELGTLANDNIPDRNRMIHIKMIATSSSATVTLYVAIEGYNYLQVVSSGTISIVDSTATEYSGINSSTTGWVSCKQAKWTDTTYSVVSNSANGLAPKVINTNTATVGSAYYVLASTNGSATPSWYKLPANAFANDDTKVTLTNTTGSASYRVLFSGNDNDTTETTTARKSANLLFNPSTGKLTAGHISTGGDIIFTGSNKDQYLYYYHNDAWAWRTGHQGTGTSDTNYFVIQNQVSGTVTTSLKIDYNAASKATFIGTVVAPTFQGNLDGTYVNKLTGYSKATAIGTIAATDSLNTALGKLEFKTDFIYNDLFGTDNDDVINKWHEIVDFIDSVKEGTDITDEFVTRKTDLTITGAKSFSTVVNITGTSNFSEGIRLHHYSNLSSLWFGAVNNSGYDPGMWGISVDTNGMRFRGTNSTTGTSASDYVNIIHGGNVGIGTSAPTLKLHVSGNVLATKFITSGGTSSQFVKGDGSLDSNKYLINTHATYTSAYYRTTTINGTNYAFWSHTNGAAFTIYAPTTAGTKGLVLTSNGSGAPVWANQSSIAAGSASKLTVSDIRDTTPTPNDCTDKAVTAWFNNKNKPSTVDTWYSGISVAGWGDGYRVWLLSSNSGNGTTDEGLFFRGGKSDTWSPWKQVAFTDGTVATANNGIFYIEGTGTTAGTWLGSHTGITSYYTGLTIAYKLPIAGASTTTLNINSLGAKTCYINTSKLTTHYGVGSVAILVYDGTYFRAADYWDGNSYAYVRQYTTDSTNSEYPLLFRYNTAAPTSNGYVTEYTRYDSGITINPSTNTITATNFKGTATLVTCPATNSDNNRPIVGTPGNNTLYHTTLATVNWKTGNITAPTFTGALKGTADKSKVLSNYYSSRQTTIKPGITGDGSMIQYKSTSTCTDTDKPGEGHILHFNWDNNGGWDSLLCVHTTTPNLSTRCMSSGTWSEWARVLTSLNYTSYLGYIGTTAVLSTSKALALTGITNLTMSGNLTITPGNTDNFITFSYNSGTTYSWRLGYLGTGSGDTNYFVVQSAKAAGTSWNNVIRLGNETLDAAFGGNIYPLVTNTQTLGTSSLRWASVYAVTGSFLSNVESVTTTGDAIKHAVTNSNGSVELLVHSNRGLYDRTNSKWIIYVPNGTTNVLVPTWASKGSSTLPVYFDGNGNPVACTAYSSASVASAAKWTTARTLTVGYKGQSVNGTANVTWNLHDILLASTQIGTSTSWLIYDPGVYYVAASSAFTGDGNPESANGGLTPYRYGQLIVSRAGTGGVAQFYISHTDSSESGRGIKYRTGWNNEYKPTWSSILDTTNFNSYAPKLDGTGASGTWGINITGSATKLTTVSKTAWGQTYWTSGGVPTSISGDMTSVGNITMSGDILVNAENDDRFLIFSYAGLDRHSWRIGYLGSGTGESNYLVIQGTGLNSGAAYLNVVRFSNGSFDAAFTGNILPAVTNTKTLGTSSLKWANVYATTFTGNLAGNATTATTANVLKATTVVSAKEFSLSNASWTNTGYTFASLTTGTYAVQVTSGSNLVASGIMSVYKNLSDTAGDEIPLHVYGTAGWRPYLRTYANKLLISSNDASATSRTVTIKIALIL